jgi:hypothetical protein
MKEVKIRYSYKNDHNGEIEGYDSGDSVGYVLL